MLRETPQQQHWEGGGSGQRLSKSCLHGGWETLVLPRLSRATLRRHLCQDTIKPGWTIASLTATRPVPSGPSLGQTPRRSVFHRGNAFSPRWGQGVRGGRPGAGCPGAHPHKARGGCGRTPWQWGSLPAGWKGPGEEEGTGRRRRRGWGGNRAPSLETPNLES